MIISAFEYFPASTVCVNHRLKTRSLAKALSLPSFEIFWANDLVGKSSAQGSAWSIRPVHAMHMRFNSLPTAIL